MDEEGVEIAYTDTQSVCDDGYGCVGNLPPGLDMRRIYFSPWFIRTGSFEDPSCSWTCEGDKITQHLKTEERDDYVWMLTDTYDDWGFRLGVWPD